MLIEGNALKIRAIRSILVKSGDIGQNFRTLSFSERCFDTQTKKWRVKDCESFDYCKKHIDWVKYHLGLAQI